MQGGRLCTGVVSAKALSKCLRCPVAAVNWPSMAGMVYLRATATRAAGYGSFSVHGCGAWGLTSTTPFPCAKVPPVARKTWFQVEPPLRLAVCMRFVGADMPLGAGVVSSVGGRRVGQRRRHVCQSDLCSVLPFEILVPGVRVMASRFLTT